MVRSWGRAHEGLRGHLVGGKAGVGELIAIVDLTGLKVLRLIQVMHGPKGHRRFHTTAVGTVVSRLAMELCYGVATDNPPGVGPKGTPSESSHVPTASGTDCMSEKGKRETERWNWKMKSEQAHGNQSKPRFILQVVR